MLKPFLLCALLAGCTHDDVARRYADALEQGRVDEAWALSAQLDREQFGARYADAGARKARAEGVRRAVSLEAKGDGWRVVETPLPVAAADDARLARERVDHFLAAVDSGDFEAVFADLSASWRARYTPARLKADFTGEPFAIERLQRIKAALPGKWEVTAAGPQLVLGEGKALKLLREGDGFKVAALE